MEIKRIMLNKNRGWRGLAELVCENDKREIISTNIFSFSQEMWNDLLQGYIVMQSEESYTILQFDNTEALPKPTQQRSVLIKNFFGTVMNQWTFSRTYWSKDLATGSHLWTILDHYTKNKNNHTTSDWNYVGIRVEPSIL